ncbi:MAG: formylglycine-generating enzyme family protein [Candidatus Bilamarchaeaceae archaeon]
MEERNLHIKEEISSILRNKSVTIPAGKFVMGSCIVEDEEPIHEVYIDSFMICSDLVTRAQFVTFLNTMMIKNERDTVYLYLNIFNRMSKVKKEDGIYIAEEGFEDHPIVCVNWYGAHAFSLWVGGRLPTEAEWEKAARGGLKSKVYPWGNKAPDPNLANFGEHIGFTSPIRKYPPNNYGIYDVAGNVWEWCADWYNKEYYKISSKKNPQGPEAGTDKVIRGGGWAYEAGDLRCARRGRAWPRIGGTNIGFRVVFDIEEKKISAKRNDLKGKNPLIQKMKFYL